MGNKVLSINVIADNSNNFLKSNEAVIQAFRNDEKVHFNYYNNPDLSEYERFRKLVDSAEAEFVCFVGENTLLDEETIKSLIGVLEKENADVVCLKIKLEKYPREKSEIRMVDLTNKAPCYLPRYIFRTNFIDSIEVFSAEEDYYKEKLFLETARFETLPLLDIYIDYNDKEYLECNLGKYAKSFDKKWYIPEIENLLLPYLKNEPRLKNQQALALYYIWRKYRNNRGNYNKNILNEVELSKFKQLVTDALRLIDDEIFFDKYVVEKLTLAHCLKFYNKKKNGESELSLQYINDKAYFCIDNILLPDNGLAIIVEAINETEGSLIIDFSVENCFREERSKAYEIVVRENNTLLKPKRTNVYSRKKEFGETVFETETFSISIPTDIEHKTDIKFIVCFSNGEAELPIRYSNTASRLSDIKASYFNFSTVTIQNLENGIEIVPRRLYRSIVRELKFRRSIARADIDKKIKVRLFALRSCYFLTAKKHARKKIWVSFDKLYKGGDNGQVLFEYVNNNISSKNMYYIINRNAKEYIKLSEKYGRKVLAYKSFWQRLITMTADVIFATHMGAFRYCGFDKNFELYLRDLLKAKVVCIQHGLTIQNMPQYQNRLKDNTRLYCCAAQKEIDNLMQPEYGYNRKELLLTGLARFDNLTNDDCRQILIAPTWRRDVVISGNEVGNARDYNPRFRETEYYNVYNSLINNAELCQTARAYGYKVVFLLHPTLGMQIKDFEKNEMLDIISGTAGVSYETYLKQSSLMITDYSGIQFDFAYMRKPIVYYHPESLPPQYDDSDFIYERDGFGPIITKQKELIDEICRSMKRNCTIEDKYKERADRFFAYSDCNSCERITEAVVAEYGE